MGRIFDHEHGSVNQCTAIYFSELRPHMKAEDNVVLSGTVLCNFYFLNYCRVVRAVTGSIPNWLQPNTEKLLHEDIVF
jgi:hypothetical protein